MWENSPQITLDLEKYDITLHGKVLTASATTILPLSWKDNDILTYFFLPIFIPPLQSLLDHHITSLKRIKKDYLMVIEAIG